jgi:MAP3K TRAFs-binding domain
MSNEINRLTKSQPFLPGAKVQKAKEGAAEVSGQEPKESVTFGQGADGVGGNDGVVTSTSTAKESESAGLGKMGLGTPSTTAESTPSPLSTGGYQILGPDGKPLPITVNADGSIQIKDADVLADLAKVAAQKNLEDPGFVNPLSGVEPKKMGPLGDILQVSAGEAREVLASRQPEIHDWAVQHKAFNAELDSLTIVHDKDGKVVYDEDTGRAKKRDIPVEALRAYEERWTKETPSAESLETLKKWMPEGTKLKDLAPQDKTLGAGQMTRVLGEYKDGGHFDDVSRFYETMVAKEPHLGKYEIPREYYIVSLNKQKRIKESIRESEAMLNERVEEVNHGPMGFIEASRRNLYRSMGVNGEVLSGLGKAYKVIHQQAETQIDEKVANADFTSLYSQLTGTDVENWKSGDSTVGAAATTAAESRFLDRHNKIAGRTDKPLQAASDMMDWVEKATGAKRDEWAQPPGQDLFTTLKGAEPDKLIGTVEELTGKSLKDWSVRREEVKNLASAPVNKLVGKVVRGRLKSDELAEKIGELAGKPLEGALAGAAQRGKLDELMESVTKRGNLDSELVGRVEHNASAPVGKNLLKASRKALEVSRDYYTAGFGVDVEYYPGINVVYTELALGNHKTAKGLIPIVQYAVMREGGATSKDYWNLATQVELGAIGDQPKTVHDLLPRLFDSAKAGWELGSTADNLAELAEKRREDGQDADLIDFVAKKFRQRIEVGFPPPDGFKTDAFVKEAQAELAKTRDVSGVPTELSPEEQLRKEITDKIMAKSKNFQEVFTSKFVGGSWKFVSRGGVSDRPINRQTIRALREVNKHLGLNELKGPEDFPVFHSRALNYIDNKFGLVDKTTDERPMEDLESAIHHKRDKFTQSRHDVFHSRTSGTAQTNLIVEVMLGQSDCRDTDATYQVMADLWKRDQQTALLQGAIDAVLDGHEATLEKSMDGAKEWDKLQVVSMDLGFFAPAKLNLDDQGNPEKYSIQKDSKDRMVRTDDGDILRWPDGSAMALEDHSMPFRLKFDDKGLILPKEEGGMKAVDPFYRHFWQLGNLDVDPRGILDEDKGFALGKAGVLASDNKSVALFGKPTKYSGAAPQDIKGEAGQVTMGGLEVAMNDLTPLLSENNELTHLTDAITGMVTGSAKERVLNAVMSRMLDESAQESHQIWKRSKDRELMDPKSPFLGAGPEKVVITKEAAALSREDLGSWLKEQAPDGAEIPQWKMNALEEAPVGTVVFDPAYQTYAELVDSGEAVRQTGEAAVAPLALSLYLNDFRHSEDLQYTLDNILSGKDAKGKEELEKVNRLAYLSAQLVMGERAFDNDVAVMQNTGEVKTTQGRRDFAAWHSLHAEDQELAELDAYTLKPAAEWLMDKLDGTQAGNGRAVLDKVVGELVESAAADAHNLGWKASKDSALADDSNPFVGWASVRNRVSCNNPEVIEMSAAEIADFYKIPHDQVSEAKAESIREATRQAVADGTQKGTDITHTLYKPYTEMLADQADGGIRGAGGNAVPLLTLALYLSDFRGSETDSVDGLKDVLAGLMTGADKDGLKDVTMLNHVAFQAAQLPYGERSFENEIPVQKNTGQTKTIKANPSLVTFASAGAGDLAANAEKIEASTTWLNRDLDELVDH